MGGRRGGGAGGGGGGGGMSGGMGGRGGGGGGGRFGGGMGMMRGGGGSGGSSMAGMGMTDHQSSTGHSIHMRGLPFAANEQDVIEVSDGWHCSLLLVIPVAHYDIKQTYVKSTLAYTLHKLLSILKWGWLD